MKMGLFRLHKKHILTLALVLCLIGLSTFRLAAAIPDEKPDHSNRKSKTTDANDVDSSEPDSDPADSDSSDPNAPSPENGDEDENDIFDLKLSTYTKINEAYGRIFTPELVSKDGLVKYSVLKRKRLDRLVARKQLKQLNPAILMGLSKEERIAFWINTYNFCTIEFVLRHYPIEPKFYLFTYPDNSIKHIAGYRKSEFFDIQWEEYTLEEIEQDFLLKRYKDPRICFALPVASVSGATLRNEPYKAERLDEQLDDQVEQYLATKKGIQLDKDNHILYLSTVFQKHKEAFLVSEYATIKKFRDRKDEERTWLNFILPHLSKEDIYYLETNDFKIRFIEVDSHLNEAP